MRMHNLAPLMLKCTPFLSSKSEHLTFIASFDFEYKICRFALVIGASFLLIGYTFSASYCNGMAKIDSFRNAFVASLHLLAIAHVTGPIDN